MREMLQREFAELFEILAAEVVLKRPRGPVRSINLPGFQPFLQILGREIDVHDLVGLLQDVIGNALLLPGAGELLDRIVQAFQVLDIQRA
jgi:hypothetical protein